MDDRRRERSVPALLDDTAWFGIREVCEMCGVDADLVVEVVEHGLVERPGGAPPSWRFPASAAFRIRRAVNLCNDLGVNLAGASLAVELLEDLDRLRSEVARLSRIAGR